MDGEVMNKEQKRLGRCRWGIKFDYLVSRTFRVRMWRISRGRCL